MKFETRPQHESITETMPFYTKDIKSAQRHLQRVDPVMNSIIQQVGPFRAKAQRDRFMTLVRSIVFQQISGAAASTILGRLEELLEPNSIAPDSLMEFTVDELRTVGLSRQKATYVLDLATKVHTGAVELRTIGRKDNHAVIAELIQIKGIGIWTAQMFLMFSLARMDVLPVDDLGIQNAIKRFYKPRGKLTKQKIENIAQPWQPYSTVACWYLWRSLDISDA